jgi:hypothetical protein
MLGRIFGPESDKVNGERRNVDDKRRITNISMLCIIFQINNI